MRYIKCYERSSGELKNVGKRLDGEGENSGPCWGACTDVFAAILKNPTPILASGPCILPDVHPTHT